MKGGADNLARPAAVAFVNINSDGLNYFRLFFDLQGSHPPSIFFTD
jgi:hypothetical protein